MDAAGRRQGGRLARAARSRARIAAGCLAVALVAAGCSSAPEEGTTASGPTALDSTQDVAAGTAAGSGTAQDETTVLAEPSTESRVSSAPSERSEVGELVKGFPAELLPVPPDSVILVTSAIPVGDADVQEVSLNLRTSMSSENLLVMYRTALVEAGFIEAPPPANPQTDLAVESVFTRSGGDELVSIGVLDADGARTVTIGGRIHTTR